MPDIHSPEQRSFNMSRVKRSGGSLESIMRGLLHQVFPDEVLQEQEASLLGRPDFALPRLRLAVFCDSCFFHGCPLHGKIPATNADFWERKLARNKARDDEVNLALANAGWRVCRVWGHDLSKEKAESMQERLREFGSP